nr:hypothetical protein [Tanacetum cinerariifolium]
MTLTFAKTHNIIAYLSKFNASEGFNQIINFLNRSSIKYALTINSNIYVSCIKQFWSSVAVKKVNDVMRLQALVDKKKMVITKATFRDALCLDDAEGVECLPNDEIFIELARMGYEKPLTKLTFYKHFSQANGSRKFNFSKHIFDSLVRNVDSSKKFYMVGKVCSGVETPLFKGMIVEQPVDEGDAEVNVDDVPAEGDVSVADDVVPTAVLSMQDDEVEPAKLQEVVEVVTTAKLITKVVTVASTTITDAAPQLTIVAAPTLTTAPSATKRREGVVIRDPEETATSTTIILSEAKSKDKGKGILVEEPKPLKKQAQIEQDEAYTKEQIDEEDSRALKRLSESQKDKVAKKQKLDEEVPVVDYEIYTENNKPYYKIKRADARYTSSNLEESKKCSWSSEGQELEAVRVLWCADYHIHYNTVDFAGRKEISTYKKVNDVTRLQALVDKKKMVITKATLRDALCLDDAEGVECLPNDEIFTELARMGYEKPSTKLTFYKHFSQANGKTPLFEGMIVEQPVDEGDAEVNVDDVPAAGVAAEGDVSAADDVVPTADVALDAKIDESADVQGRQAESQVQIYQIDLEHANKVLSMQDDEVEPAKLQETKEQMDEEDSRALKRLSESQKDKVAKKHKYTSSNLEESKKCSWSSEGQELEAVRVLWCADYHIHYNTVDFAGRKEISTYKVHSRSYGK